VVVGVLEVDVRGSNWEGAGGEGKAHNLPMGRGEMG